MSEYPSPRVYIEELGFDARYQPIAGVSTSTAGFVGMASKGTLYKPEPVTSWGQFLGLFGDFLPDSYLAYSVAGFFENGGERCVVVRVAGDRESLETGLAALESTREIDILCIPDIMCLVPKSGATFEDKKIHDDILILQSAMISQCERLKDRFVVLDSLRGFKVAEVQGWKENFDSQYAALYYPWIQVMDPIGAGRMRLVPPSGYIAGIYSRTDAEHGVHQAPADEVVRGALGLEVAVAHGEQDLLNTRGVNCIRAFPGRGICLWGARTLSSDPLWKYVNVRRLLIFLEKSIIAGTQWVVFEPNDISLWAWVKHSIEQFLSGVWRRGALAGATPDEAFFVKCDRTTMTQDDLDNGRVIVLIGVAPVKPAEFVIWRLYCLLLPQRTANPQPD